MKENQEKAPSKLFSFSMNCQRIVLLYIEKFLVDLNFSGT